jgi:BACON domain-containing protein
MKFRIPLICLSLCAAAASVSAQTVTPGNSLCIRFHTNPPFMYPPFPAFGRLTPDRLELSLVVRATGSPQVTTRLFDGTSQLASFAGSVMPLVDNPPNGVFQARFTNGPIASAPGSALNFGPLVNGTIKGLLEVQINTGSLDIRPSPLLLLMRAPTGVDPAETVSDLGWVTVDSMALCGPAAPAMSVDKTTLAFGAVTTGTAFSSQTSAQAVRLTQTGTGTVTWTVSSSAPWLVVSPTSGSGSATVNASVQFTTGLSASQTGTITFSFTGAGTTPAPIQATLTTSTSTASAAPSGAFDTPADGSTGVTGSIAVTGWATDNVEVTRVRILRDPVAGEPAGSLVFIGSAVLVDGARPDVQALYPTVPRASRAGWGYLLLTNFLPGLGNGTFKLSAIADDADGHSTTLGTKTITCANSGATAPFGAIDTPAQGGTVSGMVNNFGWVLSPGSRRADPTGGGTVQVVIDGAFSSAVPTGWTSRSDLSSLFPVAQFSGIGSALGVATFDSTALTNGVHTISWVVTDNQGSATGIGSRYFTVSNGAGLTLDPDSFRLKAEATGAEQRNSWLPPSGGNILGRRGFDLAVPYQTYRAGADGVTTIQAEELDRIELLLGAGASGFSRAGGATLPLPIGSRIDPATGVFTWNPGVGFVGAYDLVLGGRDVRIVLNPQRSNRVGPQAVIDVADGHILAGWAADLDSQVDRGVDTIHVWAYPVDAGRSGDPVFVGVADYGGARPDVAAVYGDRFKDTGYGIRVQGLAPGTYDLAVFAYSSVRGRFAPARLARVTVQ